MAHAGRGEAMTRESDSDATARVAATHAKTRERDGAEAPSLSLGRIPESVAVAPRGAAHGCCSPTY